MLSRSLIFNKILHKHTNNRNKNAKKKKKKKKIHCTQTHNIKKYMKNKNNYKEKFM